MQIYFEIDFKAAATNGMMTRLAESDKFKLKG